jgi:hypothetical protein
VLVVSLVAQHGTDRWDRIASGMEGRTSRQCRERWKSFLAPGHVNGPWSELEDNLLLALYKQHGPRWAFITRFFNGRSDYNVKNRWQRFVKLNLHRTDKCDQKQDEMEENDLREPDGNDSAQEEGDFDNFDFRSTGFFSGGFEYFE